MDGPGQRAMALSDVDSDSTCKQQRSSRQVGQKSPTASQTRERERETLLSTGHQRTLHSLSHDYTNNSTNHSCSRRDGYMST